jgi:hypothetical protein
VGKWKEQVVKINEVNKVTNSRSFLSISLTVVIILIINLISCAPQYGQVVISKPDEFRHKYEAKEKIILKAIARVFIEKSVGRNVIINHKNLTVDSDYIVQDDWRTKSNARVRRLNWKECEVILSVITEKKTDKGWELRRLLGEEQYETFFSTIELKIYEEIANIE